MSHVVRRNEYVNLTNPVFLEGLPGLGLVGKIATDHLIDQFEMDYYASIECPSLPSVAAYGANEYAALPAVRIYADEERNLLALQSDVAVSPQLVSDFASCLTAFLLEENALPLNFSGLARTDPPESSDERSLSGIATGTSAQILADLAIDPPTDAGVWSGPTGAVLNRARSEGLNSIGLIVEADPDFPDPVASCALIERGIAPITGIEVDVEPLRERAAEIRDEKQALAQEMRDPEHDESSKAEPLRMYQ